MGDEIPTLHARLLKAEAALAEARAELAAGDDWRIDLVIEADKLRDKLAAADKVKEDFLEDCSRVHGEDAARIAALEAENERLKAELAIERGEYGLCDYCRRGNWMNGIEPWCALHKSVCEVSKQPRCADYKSPPEPAPPAPDPRDEEIARLKAQACHVVLEHPDWAFVCKHEPARPVCKPTEECETAGCEASEACAPARPDAESPAKAFFREIWEEGERKRRRSHDKAHCPAVVHKGEYDRDTCYIDHDKKRRRSK